MKINVNKLPKSEIEIEGEIEASEFELYFPKALKKLGENIEMDGFRKGKAPENVLLKNIPEIRILEEMAEMALAEHYPKIMEQEKIEAISSPQISITKLARNNPLGFKIKTATLPVIELSDYKDTAKKVVVKRKKENENIEITEEEVEKTIEDIRKSRAPKKNIQEVAQEHKCEDENCEHEEKKKDKSASTKGSDEMKEELPELNDEFVKALGPFENVTDFKDKLKENLKLEKQNLAREKTRLDIMEKVIEESKIELPEILVEIELDKILYRMESDIAQMGLKFEDYLKHINKTKEDLRTEFRKDGEKKAKLGLILNEIAKMEKLVADQKRVEAEVAMILEHYKDADPERARIHAENVLTNEEVFKFLENQE